MIVGYARTSTAEQSAGLAGQIRDLEAAGAERVFSEQVSSVAERARLAEALRFMREGDEFVVTKPDRLARSTVQLLETVQGLLARGVRMRILSMGADFSTPTGKLILGVMGSIAQFERELMLERQREGIAKAKADGKYKGRAPTARARADEVMSLIAGGKTWSEAASETGVSMSSVARIARLAA